MVQHWVKYITNPHYRAAVRAAREADILIAMLLTTNGSVIKKESRYKAD